MAKKEEKTKQKSRYFKDMKAELKKVIWPTPKQLASNTLAVIAFSLIIAVIVFVLDICFDSINKYGVTPLQDKVQSSYRASHGSDESTEATENSEETEESKAENTSENEKAEVKENEEDESKTENKNEEKTENVEEQENN